MKHNKLKYRKNYKRAIIALILLFMIILIRNYYRTKNNVSNLFDVSYKGKPILTFFIDTRSTQAIFFIKNILNFLDYKEISLNINMVFLNEDKFPFEGTYKIYTKNDLHTKRYKNNSFIFSDDKGKVFISGLLSSSTQPLVKEMSKLYSIKGSEISDYFKIGDNIGDNRITKYLLNKEILSKNYNCIAFYEEICLGCQSGWDLIKLNKYKITYNNINFYYITMCDYTLEDIKRIKKNEGIKIEILIPDNVSKQAWLEIRNNIINPLLGCIIVVDNNGYIKWAINDLLKLADWLEDKRR